MKKIVRCGRCSDALRYFPPGFNSSQELYCGHYGEAFDVDPDDGCTFGKPGFPKTATSFDYHILLGGDAAVNGEECD